MFKAGDRKENKWCRKLMFFFVSIFIYWERGCSKAFDSLHFVLPLHWCSPPIHCSIVTGTTTRLLDSKIYCSPKSVELGMVVIILVNVFNLVLQNRILLSKFDHDQDLYTHALKESSMLALWRGKQFGQLKGSMYIIWECCMLQHTLYMGIHTHYTHKLRIRRPLWSSLSSVTIITSIIMLYGTPVFTCENNMRPSRVVLQGTFLGNLLWRCFRGQPLFAKTLYLLVLSVWVFHIFRQETKRTNAFSIDCSMA